MKSFKDVKFNVSIGKDSKTLSSGDLIKIILKLVEERVKDLPSKVETKTEVIKEVDKDINLDKYVEIDLLKRILSGLRKEIDTLTDKIGSQTGEDSGKLDEVSKDTKELEKKVQDLGNVLAKELKQLSIPSIEGLVTEEELKKKLDSISKDMGTKLKQLPNVPQQATGFAVSRLIQIADIRVTDLQNGEALTWDATSKRWVNSSIEVGGGSWGEISGTLSDQTDLQAALDSKTDEAYVNTAVASLVDSSPEALDTLNELAEALGDDPNFSTTVTNQIASKQDELVSGINIKTLNSTTLLGSGNISIVENATHTGEVTGSTTLILDKTAISNKTDTTILANDILLFGDTSDSNNLKKGAVQDILDLTPTTSAAGDANQVQYNDGSNGFAASGNFAFDGANTLNLGDENGANIGVNNTYTSGYNFGTANTTGNATATTVGNENTANGVRQTIVGSRNSGGSLSDTVLVGFDNTISGFFGFANTAIGNGCTVGSGGFTAGSTAMGFNCSTNGSAGTLAIGVSCTANNAGSVAAGNSVTNSNGNSYKFGYLDANSILMSAAGIVSSYGQQWQTDGSILSPVVAAEPAAPVEGIVTHSNNDKLFAKNQNDLNIELTNSSSGGYIFYNSDSYSDTAPLTLLTDATQTIAFNISSTVDNLRPPFAGNDLISSDKITPVAVADAYTVTLKFKGDSTVINNELTIELDIGGTFGVIQTERVNFGQDAGVEREFTVPITFFTGSTFVANGGSIKITADEEVDLYDFSILMIPLTRGQA